MLLTEQKYANFGNFLVHKLFGKYERKNVALYCNEALAIFTNVTWSVSEEIRKYFYKWFRYQDLEITIQCNRKVMNFQGVTLNLENSTHRPYLKDSNKIIYVNT